MSETIDTKKEAKKSSLLQAALDLFLEKGVSKTSISEIDAAIFRRTSISP